MSAAPDLEGGPARPRRLSALLALAATLAAAAGFVDAHIWLQVTPVFVANMSGNLIHLGIFLGDFGWRSAAASITAIGSFVLGVALATVHHDREIRRRRSTRADQLLWAEALLVLTLPVMIAGFDLGFSRTPRALDYPVVVIGAIAMGIQSATIRRVGTIAVTTTYGTGALVRIGENAQPALASPEPDHRARGRRTVAVLSAVMASYVGGAAAASAAGSAAALLLIPTAALVGTAVVVRRGNWELGKDPAPPLEAPLLGPPPS